MDFYESDLEDIIWDCLKTTDGANKLTKKGLHMERPIRSYRQFKIGNYGVADIITVEKHIQEYSGNFLPKLYINVYELKKGEINLDSLVQVIRYIKGVRSYFEERGCNVDMYDIRGTLIGRSLNISEWVYILEHIKEIDVYTYRYTLDGIIFKYEESDYELINPGFKINRK
jgi:hypothetical protein